MKTNHVLVLHFKCTAQVQNTRSLEHNIYQDLLALSFRIALCSLKLPFVENFTPR